MKRWYKCLDKDCGRFTYKPLQLKKTQLRKKNRTVADFILKCPFCRGRLVETNMWDEDVPEIDYMDAYLAGGLPIEETLAYAENKFPYRTREELREFTKVWKRYVDKENELGILR